MDTASIGEAAPSREGYLRLFLRFLRFGFLAWGGPVAQIAMIRQELVEEERWISSERFNRVLAVYQVLPGPEAHELCVYFGMVARGRLGGLLGGLGFMLPGFVLMLFLSWFYIAFGISFPIFAGAFYGMQAAVAALIVRAVVRIGGHALHDKWLWLIAVLALFAQFGGINFVLTLVVSGFIYVLRKNGQTAVAYVTSAAFFVVILLSGLVMLSSGGTSFSSTSATGTPSVLGLFGSGLRSGLLTFGGAYTVIPYLQNDAVVTGNWMTNGQFLDGLALSGILPAPLVIFGTFVGYIGAGFWGALALTTGIFLPAFSFTLVGHDFLERLVENTSLHTFLDGVTAGVVGLITFTMLVLFRDAVKDYVTFAIFVVGLLILFKWKSKMNVPVVVIGAGAAGLLVSGL